MLSGDPCVAEADVNVESGLLSLSVDIETAIGEEIKAQDRLNGILNEFTGTRDGVNWAHAGNAEEGFWVNHSWYRRESETVTTTLKCNLTLSEAQ